MTSTPMNTCTCGVAVPANAKFCSNCGRSAQLGQTTIDQSNNHGGLNNTGHVGRDLICNFPTSWDQRVRIPHERTSLRRLVLPPDMLSVLSALISIGGLFGITRLNLPLYPMLATVGISLVFACIAILLMHSSQAVARHGFALLPLGLGALERGDGRGVWLTKPISLCPFCPEGRAGFMHLIETNEGTKWQCEKHPDHALGFDFTQMPPLDPSTAI